jgi:hypothetical protein
MEAQRLLAISSPPDAANTPLSRPLKKSDRKKKEAGDEIACPTQLS